jgi:hypothetical protein
MIFISTPNGARPCFSLYRTTRLAVLRDDGGCHGAERAERAHLGHAPGVDDFDFVVLFEGAEDALGHSRAADDHRFR